MSNCTRYFLYYCAKVESAEVSMQSSNKATYTKSYNAQQVLLFSWEMHHALDGCDELDDCSWLLEWLHPSTGTALWVSDAEVRAIMQRAQVYRF
jgi:hypothetical protein